MKRIHQDLTLTVPKVDFRIEKNNSEIYFVNVNFLLEKWNASKLTQQHKSFVNVNFLFKKWNATSQRSSKLIIESLHQ